MKEQRSGHIINVSSVAGHKVRPGNSIYAATKHALKAIADSLREEVNPDGVRVVSVYPGRTATPMQEKVHEQEGRTYDASRWIRPETVVDSVVHVLDLPPDATIPELVIRPR